MFDQTAVRDGVQDTHESRAYRDVVTWRAEMNDLLASHDLPQLINEAEYGTSANPATVRKIAILTIRYHLGLTMWHPNDETTPTGLYSRRDTATREPKNAYGRGLHFDFHT